jgi:hypothetical protein
MKKNLLITIGDSWSSGAGCGLSNKPGIRLRESFTSEEEYLNYREEIHLLERTYGWANVCANLLNYDLINMARPGWSNPGLVKNIIDDVQHIKYKTMYDRVIVVYVLSDPHRFSLFTNYNLQHISTRGFTFWQKDDDDPKDKNFRLPQLPETKTYKSPTEINDIIWQAFIDYMIPVGAMKETVFSLKCMEHFCRSCGYEFYWGTAFTPYKELHPYYLELNNCIHYNEFDSFKDMIFNKHGMAAFAPDAHPNELGYEEIAKYIFSKLPL